MSNCTKALKKVYDHNNSANAEAVFKFSHNERITSCLELYHTEEHYALFAHNYHLALTGKGLIE